MSRIFLIDASPYIFRAYYSIPETIVTPDGRMANAAYGFTEFLIQVLKKENPSHLAIAFDGSLTTSFRNDIYPAYKAQRTLPPAELEAQMQICQEVAMAMGMRCFVDDRFESDDLIGTILDQLGKPELRFVIVSNDKDFRQLVDDQVTIWDFARDVYFDDSAVQQAWGVRPEQVVDYLALTGDSVDNIPGVKGIGPKSAAFLLQKFETLAGIYDSLDTIPDLPLRGSRSVRDRLAAGREMAETSKTLVTISAQAPLAVTLADLAYEGAERHQIDPLFDQLGFQRIKDRIPIWREDA